MTKPTEDYLTTLQFPSGLWSIVVFSAHCFGFPASNFIVLVQSCLSAAVHSMVQDLLSTKQETHNLSDNIVEHFVA